MAQKKPLRPPAPSGPSAASPHRDRAPWPIAAPAETANVLMDWRFNLIVIVTMEILLILFALPREIERHRITAAREALLRGEYNKAYGLYYLLESRSKDNPGYLKALGDIALGRQRWNDAEKYYQEAGANGYGGADLKIQVARVYYEKARRTPDRELQGKLLDAVRQLLQMARQDSPNNLTVNYWLGWFALESLDPIEAADFFSRVRAEVLPPGWKPNEEQAQLIKQAQVELAKIRGNVFEGKEYPLDLTGLEIVTTPTLPKPTPVPAPKPPVTPPPTAVPTAAPPAKPPTTAPVAATPAPTPKPATTTPVAATPVAAPKPAIPTPAASATSAPKPATTTPVAATPAPPPKPAPPTPAAVSAPVPSVTTGPPSVKALMKTPPPTPTPQPTTPITRPADSPAKTPAVRPPIPTKGP